MAERYHLVGIGGAGMSGLARLLLAEGYAVSGSDARESATLAALRAAGARVAVGHVAANLENATHLVYTDAATPDNPELVEAERRGLTVCRRARLLARLMEGRIGIAIAGTHGKTTTTGMTAAIFLAAGLDPRVLIGGDWSVLDGNAHPGRGPHFLAEACEAFHSFLELSPDVAVLTNIEADHLDCHGSLEGVIEAFRQFLARLRPGGQVVGCGDDPRVRVLAAEVGRPTVYYGIEEPADYRAGELSLHGERPRFTLLHGDRRVGEVDLAVPGRHNVLNALAAAAAALEQDVPFTAVQRGLAEFRGVERRFDRLGEPNGILVVDDYAHHPTEVAATLAAARAALGRPITAVFQPHLFSRTELLQHEFGQSFSDADRVLVTEIYPAREAPIPGITGETVVRRIREREPGKPVSFEPDRDRLLELLRRESRPGDVVVTMGAGDIRSLGVTLVDQLREGAAWRASG